LFLKTLDLLFNCCAHYFVGGVAVALGRISSK
jgi:hypothetical protein